MSFADWIRSLWLPPPCPPPVREDDGESAIPQGLGLTVRGLTALGSPDQMVAWLDEHRVRWVKLIIEDRSGQVATYYPDRLPDYVTALNDAGIEVWTWGWPWAGKPRQYAEHVLRERDRLGFRGHVLNGEKQWWWTSRGRGADSESICRREADTVFGTLEAGGLDLMFSSYGNLDSFAKMPHEEIAPRVVAGQPQIYSADPARVARLVESWTVRGYGSVVPVIGSVRRSYNDPSLWAARADAMLEAGADAINVWEAYNLARNGELHEEVIALGEAISP